MKHERARVVGRRAMVRHRYRMYDGMAQKETRCCFV